MATRPPPEQRRRAFLRAQIQLRQKRVAKKKTIIQTNHCCSCFGNVDFMTSMWCGSDPSNKKWLCDECKTSHYEPKATTHALIKCFACDKDMDPKDVLSEKGLLERKAWLSTLTSIPVENARHLRYLNKLQYCPVCRTAVERTEGCDHMECAVCQTPFGYANGMPRPKFGVECGFYDNAKYLANIRTLIYKKIKESNVTDANDPSIKTDISDAKRYMRYIAKTRCQCDDGRGSIRERIAQQLVVDTKEILAMLTS